MMFEIHEQLAQDTLHLGTMSVSIVLLMKNAIAPWVILLPKVKGVSCISDFEESQRKILIEEMSQVEKSMNKVFTPDRMNVGILGNIVSQFHIHIIARYKKDLAWPGPIWGKGKKEYSENSLLECSSLIQKELSTFNNFVNA